MTVADIEAIVGGYHGDAFRVLGPHIVQKRDAQPRWEVRAFLPQAHSADVVIGETVVPMVKRHKEGLFVALLDGEQQTYRIRARPPDGRSVEYDDPYRFPPLLSSFELHLHGEGTNYESYAMLGAHVTEVDGVHGTRFAVWAPNAEAVTLVGDFNDWDTRRHPMRLRDGGIWEFFLPGAGEGCAYKYNVRSRVRAYRQLKADPYAFYCEKPPKSASIVANLDKYAWGDQGWMEARAHKEWLREPVSIYEVHAESWFRGPHGEPLVRPKKESREGDKSRRIALDRDGSELTEPRQDRRHEVVLAPALTARTPNASAFLLHPQAGQVDGIEDAVMDAALVPVTHHSLGEEPAAVVHLKPGHHTTEAELRAFVAGRLAAFKVPVKVVFWPETLPRNANGKILKSELKRAVA